MNDPQMMLMFAQIGMCFTAIVVVWGVIMLVGAGFSIWRRFFPHPDTATTYTATIRLGGDPKDRLIEALDEYIELSGKEIKSLIGIATVHHWQSSLVKEGEACRDKIARCRKDVEAER